MKKTIIETCEPEARDSVFLKDSVISGSIYATHPFQYPWVLRDEFYVRLDNGKKVMITKDVFCGIGAGSEIGKEASWDSTGNRWIVNDRAISSPNAYIVGQDDSIQLDANEPRLSLFDLLARN